MEKIKESEAKILVYLSVVPNIKKNVVTISNKLRINYGYLLGVLQSMVAKGWVFKHKHGRYMAYDLTPKAPLELAKEWYIVNARQMPLPETQEELTKNDDTN